MTAAQAHGWTDVYEIPSFFDRLEEAGGIPVLDLVEELTAEGAADIEIDADGVVYHDRGIRVPGYDATFVHEPSGSRGRPAFSVEVDSVGPRNTWAVFDRTLSWDVYLLRTQGMAAVAWLSDEEYRIEEAEQFATKRDAVAAGRFSFGVYLYAGEDWQERKDRIERTNAPAYLRSEDGSIMLPSTQSEFYEYVNSTPTEFRTSGGSDQSYLGILELEITID
ncbi:hypothetical protein [Halopiger djelfimassiliensis]|uniref:hypothetical protein n=1 Tax=Halopiger djelfimassiliensis TaxID=1293047 RepID=UPI000677D7B4|nr:hypothetical protein [Halopiger djelfimassiliensis]